MAEQDKATVAVPSSRNDGWIAFVIVGALLLFGVVSWSIFPGAFVSDDAWFYPVIARNFALYGEVSFSRIVPTNGVHPLWFGLLAAYSKVASLASPDLLWRPAFAVPLAALLLAAGTVTHACAARRFGIPGALYCCVVLGYQVAFGLLYSEAAATCAALGALLVLSASQPRRGRGVALGVVYACVILARLDCAFLVGAHAACFAFVPAERRRVWVAALLAAAMVAPYLIANRIFLGGFLPVSGWLKSTFPEIHVKAWWFAGLATSWRGYNVAFGLIPIFSAFPILWRCRCASPELRRITVVWTMGCLMHALYTVLFTDHFTQWFWYYVPNVILAGLLIGMVSLDLANRLPVTAVAGLLAIAIAVATVRDKWHATPGKYQAFSLAFAREHRGDDTTVLVSDWPGFVAFHTRWRVMAADLLTANRRLYDDLAAAPDALARLLEVCRQSGAPVKYVMLLGHGWWLEPDESYTEITYRDPWARHGRRVVGRASLGPPVYLDRDTRTAVWRLPP